MSRTYHRFNWKHHIKHRSDLRFCGCRMCSRGLHRCKYNDYLAQYARRQLRRRTKLLCRKAISSPEIDIPERISVTYTD